MLVAVLTFRTVINWLNLQLLLMKRGGQVIYMGPLGPRSHKLVEYFEVSCTYGRYLLMNLLRSGILYQNKDFPCPSVTFGYTF